MTTERDVEIANAGVAGQVALLGRGEVTSLGRPGHPPLAWL